MNYKLEVAKSLRKGLAIIRLHLNKQTFADNPLWTHWIYLAIHQESGVDWQ